jgi:hypothetical protein
MRTYSYIPYEIEKKEFVHSSLLMKAFIIEDLIVFYDGMQMTNNRRGNGDGRFQSSLLAASWNGRRRNAKRLRLNCIESTRIQCTRMCVTLN